MARFYGEVHGSRGPAHRLGGSAGLTTTAAGWQGCVRVRIYDHEGADHVTIRLATWSGAGIDKLLYDGPVNPKAAKLKALRKR